MPQAESNQRKQALDALGKRSNTSDAEKQQLESRLKGLMERQVILTDTLKKAEAKCLYLDQMSEQLSGRHFSPGMVSIKF